MKKIFVNGTFDILHPGHIALLDYAKSHGDYLLVAIDADKRVKALKSPLRPINNSDTRKIMIGALKAVDDVKVFSTNDELRDIIKEYEPDIMVVGDDYQGNLVIGSEYAKELLFFKKIKGYSTSKIIENIDNR